MEVSRLFVLLALLVEANVLCPALGCLGMFTDDPIYVVKTSEPCDPGPVPLPGGHVCTCECPRPQHCILRCRDHLGDEGKGDVGRSKSGKGLLDHYETPVPRDPYEKDP